MSQRQRRSPRQHTVHPTNPRYDVTNYNRGQGDRVALVSSPDSPSPDRWDRQYSKIENLKKLIERKENEIEEIKIRIREEEEKLDKIREARAPKLWLKLIKAERDPFSGWLAEVETSEGKRLKLWVNAPDIKGGKRFEGEIDSNTLTILKQPSHTGGRVRVKESQLQASLDYLKERDKDVR